MGEPIDWNKVAAIGQVAGAVATFLAVWVALYLARSERQFRLRVRARFGQILTVGGSTNVVTIEVANVGLRTAHVTGFGWTTGYANPFRLTPKALRLKSAFQLPDYEWIINPAFPWSLEPGEEKSTHMRRAGFIESFAEPHEHGLFRKLPLQTRARLFRHRVYVQLKTRDQLYPGKVDPKITEALNAAYRG